MLKQLQERLKKLLADASAIEAKYKADGTNGAPAMSAEDFTQYKTLITEAEGLKDQIGVAKRTEEVRGWAGESSTQIPIAGTQPSGQVKVEGMVPAGETVIEFSEYVRDRRLRKEFMVAYQEGDGIVDQKTIAAIASNDYRDAFRRYIRGGDKVLTSNEYKVLQEGADSQGGFLVPEDMLNRIISKLPAPTFVQSRVSRFPTGRDTLVVPKVKYSTDDIYTSGIRVTWTGEVPTSSTQHAVTDPVFGQARIPVHTAMMSMPITQDMIEDSSFPIVTWSTDKFSETIDLLYDNMIINGTALGQPAGILLNPNGADQPATVGTGSSGALTADGIISLAYALPPQYDDNAAFVMNKTNVGAAAAKLKDSQNRYLWGMGVDDSGLSVSLKGRKLLGYDVLFSQFMPNLSAGGFPIIFGDLRGYYLVPRVGFSVQVLNEILAQTNQKLLLGRVRFGGQVVEDWRLKIQVAT